MSKIKVAVKDPGKTPRSVNISRRLENLQKTVGGDIEKVNLTSDLVVICNEEGKIKGLPYNCSICGWDFVGTIIICGLADDEFADIPCDWTGLKTIFPNLWESPRFFTAEDVAHMTAADVRDHYHDIMESMKKW